MPWYNDLRPPSDDDKKDYSLVFPEGFTKSAKKRTIENVLALRKGLTQNIPPKVSDKNLLIASWNIKEFGHTSQRMPESYYYMAEVINSFDLVAIQEVKRSLKDIQILMRLLGSNWAYLINDITEGTKGNSERSAYIYNKLRVQPSGLAGEISLWNDLNASTTIKQLHRSPFITGFISGWKKFALINLHLIPGDTKTKIAARFEEVDLLMQAIEYKLDNDRFWSDNLILIGDMNFYNSTASKPKDKAAIERILMRFEELDSLIGLDTNASKTQSYDRMFFHINEFFKLASNSTGKTSAGVFPVFDFIFKNGSHNTYKSKMIKDYGNNTTKDLKNNESDLTAYFKEPWRKNQVSDHYPIWSEIIIDSSDDFLNEKLDGF